MSQTNAESITPMMAQYLRAKQAHPDSILFFRMGDFFEMFYEDAKTAARVLGLALTARSKGEGAIPMAGVPVRSHTRYLQQLIRAGFKVAICEQMQDPALADGLVERDVVRIVTAGTLTEEELLDGKQSNFLLSVHFSKDGSGKDLAGLAWADLSTGAFLVDRVPAERLPDELARIAPAEIVLAESLREKQAPRFREIERAAGRGVVSTRPDWSFLSENALRRICEHFRVKTLEGFGLDNADACVPAAGALLEYLRETQKTALTPIEGIEIFRREKHCLLDRATRATLELTENLRTPGTGEKEATLLSILDETLTPMGARLLRQWVVTPLCTPAEILERQHAVAELVRENKRRTGLRERLRAVLDIERLLAKLSLGRGNARDLVALRHSLDGVPHLREILAGTASALLANTAASMDPLSELRSHLSRALADDAPMTLKDGGMIRAGFSAELDELKTIRDHAVEWMARYQATEIERTGISTLKVGFNRVFGYYIEITHANAAAAPANYIRKQTLKNAERYITPELKEFEEKVLHSEERAKELEYKLFLEAREAAVREASKILATARGVALLDCLASLAEIAATRRYAAPEIHEGEEIRIVEGRHPVLDRTLTNEPFVPNDTTLDRTSCQMMMLTGPNMSGKSTYIRQVALIVLMAQMGSFVPAQSASIGVVDRIFTRIGAADEIARGNSTFMVEMVETANILRNATTRSLVILDEVGRGTSTFDGLAIAWAVAEHIADKVGARALFATHYHQLTALSERFAAVRNFHSAVREWGDEIVFLHKIVEGGTDRSYGIHVAQIAGVPAAVVKRSREILSRLEEGAEDLAPRILGKPGKTTGKPQERQMDLFAARKQRILDEIRALDPEQITPMQALLKLKQLRDEIG